MQGLIFDIKRFAVHDGPGIRQTIFFKGCPLDCRWCHNPESKKYSPESFCLKRKFGNHISEETESVGRWMSAGDIIDSVEKDRVFYEESGGCGTFSGGEPLLQTDFLSEVIQLSKKSGFHTSVDTCGYASESDLKKIIPFTDLFLFDVKMTNNNKHKEYTGVSNELIIKNLKLLDEIKMNVLVRYPLIPGVNDLVEDIAGLAALVSSLKNIRTVCILPFHRLSEAKHKKFGYTYRMGGTMEPEKSKIETVSEILKSSGLTVRTGS